MAPGDSFSRGQKRKLDQQDGAALLGVGATLSGLNGDTPKDGASEEDGGEWQTVDRSSKRQKKNNKNQNYPAITHSNEARIQSFVKISDLQNLVLYLLADGNGPQWVSVRHKKDVERVVCLLVPGLEADLFNDNIPLDSDGQEATAPAAGEEEKEENNDVETEGETVLLPKSSRKVKTSISPDDYYPTKLVSQKLPTALEPLAEIFPHIWPIKTPGDFNRMHSPLNAMLNSPLPKSKEDKKFKGPRPPREGAKWQNVRTPITEFLASKEELQDNGYSVHPAHLNSPAEHEVENAKRFKACRSKEDGWIDLPEISSLEEGQVPSDTIEKGSVTQGRKVLVIDCEMITTTEEKFALARVSLIDWDGNLVLDELVKPPHPVKDYLTPYSGITKEMMEPVTQTLPDIQARLKEILTPDTIIAGHSLDSDLRALRITFPFVVDTTLLYPHPKGPPQKSSLKWLTQKYLSREIQNRGPTGHDSIEDAKACLDLIKQKCEKGKAWGTSEATSESIFKRLSRYDSNGEITDADTGRTGAVVDWGDPKRGFGGSATAAIACENDTDVVAGVKRAVLGPKTAEDIIKDENIPPQGCDFTWARLRELEALRGWWNRTKSIDAAERLASTLSTTGTTSSSLTTAELEAAVTRTIDCIKQIWEALPPKTAFMVYSGSGDPRELRRLTELQQEFKRCFQTMKWDELPVKWTDVEEQELKAAVVKARSGVGFLCVK